ncbi:hypothetical protein FRB94_013094 [Tulasnella sp. JGI-2019a]|nr:hypothetical protein FRB94_013094 [Tulasnella sp. JGI-2019a]
MTTLGCQILLRILAAGAMELLALRFDGRKKAPLTLFKSSNDVFLFLTFTCNPRIIKKLLHADLIVLSLLTLRSILPTARY